MTSVIYNRIITLGKDTISTFHPHNFIKKRGVGNVIDSLTRTITTTSNIPPIIHNHPTTLNLGLQNHTAIPTRPITLVSALLPQNEKFNLPNLEEFISEFVKKPILTIQKYFQLPENFIPSLITVLITIIIIAIIIKAVYNMIDRALFGTGSSQIPIQILDVAVFNGFEPEWRVSNSAWLNRAAARFHLHQDEINFMRTISDRSGIGHATHYSPGIVQWPPDLGLNAARQEAEIVMYYCIDKLLADNNIKPQDVDIIVTNCSLFNPTPSMASMIINHYKMRSDVQSFHLGGMGCGISPLSVNVASSCLRLHHKKHPIAIVLSMENITQNIYVGRERAFMLQNALFRLGGAAVLLTRDTTAVLGRPMPKWTIQHSNHIHTASNTDGYTCVFQDIDREDRQGVRLDKALMSVAAGAITKNLNIIGPKILPLYAKLDYVFRLGAQIIRTKYRTMLGLNNGSNCVKEKMIVPNFRLAVQHFCVHAGGRAVLTAIQDSLNLTDADMKPSRDTLYKYGNTSSSSIWYEYNQVECYRQPKKNDIMLLIAVGSGFKANLLILKALRNIKSNDTKVD